MLHPVVIQALATGPKRRTDRRQIQDQSCIMMTANKQSNGTEGTDKPNHIEERIDIADNGNVAEIDHMSSRKSRGTKPVQTPQ